jgi:hypothetical protein
VPSSAIEVTGTSASSGLYLDAIALTEDETVVVGTATSPTPEDDALIDDYAPIPPLRVRTLKVRIQRVGTGRPRFGSETGFALFAEDE